MTLYDARARSRWGVARGAGGSDDGGRAKYIFGDASVNRTYAGTADRNHAAGRVRRPYLYLELAEDMEEKDLHYLSVLGTRKNAVAQLDLIVSAASSAAHNNGRRRWCAR